MYKRQVQVLGLIITALLFIQLRLAQKRQLDREEVQDILEKGIDAMYQDTAQHLTRMKMELLEFGSRENDRTARVLAESQQTMREAVLGQLVQMEKRLGSFALENEQKLEQMRQSTEKRLELIQRDNNQRLDEMRGIVDEKLQKTLEERMTKSFALVNERLEQVLSLIHI